jgi:hypothetical protein
MPRQRSNEDVLGLTSSQFLALIMFYFTINYANYALQICQSRRNLSHTRNLRQIDLDSASSLIHTPQPTDSVGNLPSCAGTPARPSSALRQQHESAAMSLKGVRQMKELVIRYSDYDGSSRGVREWIRTNLVGFAEANPDLSVKTELKRNVHPYVQGHYANGNSKTICVKNLQPDGIEDFIFDLRNQIGRKVRASMFICICALSGASS